MSVPVQDFSAGVNTTTAVLTLPGVPPSWQNRRGHWAKAAREKKLWRVRAHVIAHDARAKKGWNKPADEERARVEIVLYRVRELDHDNAYSSVKPILDGLQDALIFSDAPSYCELRVRQKHVDHYLEQVTIVTVEKLKCE